MLSGLRQTARQPDAHHRAEQRQANAEPHEALLAACVKGLGLRRIGHTVEVQDTPENRGMMNKAYYLLRVEG